MLLFAWYILTKTLKISFPLSACMTFGRLVVSLKTCSYAFLIATPYLDLSGSNHAYLDKLSVTTIINLNASLCFES